MQKHIEEAEKYVEITGFRNANIKDTEEFMKAARKQLPQKTSVQFFNAELVASWQHLYFEVLNALLAFKNGRNISKTAAMEVMLYASAQRQISKAIQLIGVKPASANVAAVIISENPENLKAALSAVSKHIGAKPDETVLELTNAKIQSIRKAFKVSTQELEAVTEKKNIQQALVNLIIERTALLSTQL